MPAVRSPRTSDPTEAAIVGDEAVALYGLTVLDHDVGDTSRSRASSRSRRTRASIAVARRAHGLHVRRRTTSPGALFAAIEPFARAGLDLVRLVSRPLPATPWKYRFDAVVAGHPLDPAVQVALRELDAVTRTLRVARSLRRHTRREHELTDRARRGSYVLRVRREISDLDRSLVELVNKRLKLVAQLWRYKDEHGIGHVDPAREEWMLQYLQRLNRGPLSEEGLGELHHELLDLMKRELGAERRERRRVRSLVRGDRVLLAQRQRDLVQAVEQAVAREVVELEREAAGRARLEVDRELLAARRAPSAPSPAPAAACTGSSPILSEFWRKMSPNDGATTASKP